MRFFAEMRKTMKLRKLGKGVNIHIKSYFETDVQAAIAYCVIHHLFKTCVAEIRRKEDTGKKKKMKPYTPSEKKGGGFILKCHTTLVSVILRWAMVGAFSTVALTLRSPCFVRVASLTSRTSQKM